MVNGTYSTKENKIEGRLERLKVLLEAYLVTNTVKESPHALPSESFFESQLKEWAQNLEIHETDFSLLVQELVRENRK